MPKKTDNFFDPHWSEKATVRVKRVGDRCELFYEGSVTVKVETMSELTISTPHISDPLFLQRISCK